MKNLLNSRDRDQLIERLSQITPDHRAKWGKMNARQVIPHLTDPLRCATGERPAIQLRSPLSLPLLRDLVVWIAPWPKSAATSDSFIQGRDGTPPGEFDRDKQALILAIHRFTFFADSEHFHSSPVFGPISNRAWGRLMWRHLDHHLRQFGL